jgi:hypothetical protein
MNVNEEMMFTSFYVWLTVHLNYMNNQKDVLFTLRLFSYHTSTCFGRISSPSSGGRIYIYIYVANITFYKSELTVIGPGFRGTPSGTTTTILKEELR